MKIGILECGHPADEIAVKHGQFPQMFARLLDGHGLTFASYDVENMVFPEGIHACDGWLLTGSKHGAYDDKPFIPPLETFIRDAFDKSVPMVGICFGHQIIAQALGGTVKKFDGGWGLGLDSYDFGALGEVQLNAWHQDQVIEKPDGAKTVASNAFCEHAALLYGKKAFTIQPHPEFSGDIIAAYATTRRGTLDYPDDGLDRAIERHKLADSNHVLAQQIAEFFLQSRG